MSDRKFSALLSPCFLFCLGLLLLNDFVLKHTFHNWLTGKLSDFAGLFIFPLFFSVFFPRFTRAIYFSTALLFIVWKSPYSQPLIDGWNSQHVWMIGRTVDYTDLLALCCLPLSYRYYHHHRSFSVHQIKAVVVSGIAVFAFAATQPATHKVSFTNEFSFDVSFYELTKRINSLKPIDLDRGEVSKEDKLSLEFSAKQFLPVRMEINFVEYRYRKIWILVSGNSEKSKISLLRIDIGSFNQPDKEAALSYFQKEFIEPLKTDQVMRSTQIFSIRTIRDYN